MSVPDYSHEQEMLSRRIREALDNFDFSKMSRDDVAEVLEWEKTEVRFGDKENLTWLEGLEEESE